MLSTHYFVHGDVLRSVPSNVLDAGDPAPFGAAARTLGAEASPWNLKHAELALGTCAHGAGRHEGSGPFVDQYRLRVEAQVRQGNDSLPPAVTCGSSREKGTSYSVPFWRW